MKKIILVFTVSLICGIQINAQDLISRIQVNAQDLISRGTNSWIFHTPDDGRTSMYIAPKTSRNWDWKKRTVFYNNGNIKFSGNVGIGTSRPLEKLQVNGNITASGKIGFITRDAFNVSGNSVAHYGMSKISGTGYHHIGLSGFFGLNFYTDGKQRVKVLKNGNLGIGTQNPDEKLTVKGKIHAEEVRVDLNVPADYVFQKYYTGASLLKETYKMPTLEEVAAFTKKNHHLPEVPSAAQIQKEGLHLKQMTNLLLQKIEELTLYTIEQEKRINALEIKLVENKS